MKYKVIYKQSNNITVTSYFRNLRCAYEFAEMTNGIVLNAKGGIEIDTERTYQSKGIYANIPCRQTWRDTTRRLRMGEGKQETKNERPTENCQSTWRVGHKIGGGVKRKR